MKLIGIMPVRNESWVLRASISAALQWCDELVIGLHECRDSSEEIVRAARRMYPGRVHWFEIRGQWDEMFHRQMLLNQARSYGTTHIAIIDADEILAKPLRAPIHKLIECLNPGQMLQIPLFNLRGSLYRYHSNGLWANRIATLAFADEPRLCWSGDGFHHREPFYANPTPWRPSLDMGIMHLWGASECRLAAKHRAYRITERLKFPDKPVATIEREYSRYATDDPPMSPKRWDFAPVPEDWWGYEVNLIDVDAEPWQIAECDRLIAQHGREMFRGLTV